VPRLLLISDGNENLGSVARAIWQARQLGLPIDTVALAGRPKPGLRLESVTVPGQVFSGERFPIDVAVEAPGAAHARVELTAEGKTIGASDVQLAAGVNRLRLEASVNTVGAIALAGKVAAGDLGEARFEDTVTLRGPRVLLVSRDPALSEEHIIRALHANQFEVEQAPGGVPSKLDDFQLVVINNWDMESIPASVKAALEAYVKQGGGLVWIAGEHNIYVDKKGKPEDALERTLPAKLAPPRSPEGTAVVLIIDKSSSMEGRKIELARLAAIGVVENLRPIDSVGVLIFDNSFQWAVPIRKAEDRGGIKKLISGITPDGGTQIAPALTEAYQRILPQPAMYKHIVLLTDGISEEGDAMTLTKEALANHVTISTVGLGQDVNRAFLEKVAANAEGKSYFLNDPSGLEQILLRDVQDGVSAQAETSLRVKTRPAPHTHASVTYGCESPNDPGAWTGDRVAWQSAMSAYGGGSERFCWLADSSWPGDYIEPATPGTIGAHPWITGDADYQNWGINTANIVFYIGDANPYVFAEMYPGASPVAVQHWGRRDRVGPKLFGHRGDRQLELRCPLRRLVGCALSERPVTMASHVRLQPARVRHVPLAELGPGVQRAAQRPRLRHGSSGQQSVCVGLRARHPGLRLHGHHLWGADDCPVVAERHRRHRHRHGRRHGPDDQHRPGRYPRRLQLWRLLLGPGPGRPHYPPRHDPRLVVHQRLALTIQGCSHLAAG